MWDQSRVWCGARLLEHAEAWPIADVAECELSCPPPGRPPPGPQVLQSMKEDERRSLTPLQLRKKAAEFALKTVDQQREQFKRWVCRWGSVWVCCWGCRGAGRLLLGWSAGPCGQPAVRAVLLSAEGPQQPLALLTLQGGLPAKPLSLTSSCCTPTPATPAAPAVLQVRRVG